MRFGVNLPGPFFVVAGSKNKQKDGGGLAVFVAAVIVIAALLAALTIVVAVTLLCWLIDGVRWLLNRRRYKRGLRLLTRPKAVQLWYSFLMKKE